MKWILIIAAVVILIIWKRKTFERLDKEHEEYLKQDGCATYIILERIGLMLLSK